MNLKFPKSLIGGMLIVAVCFSVCSCRKNTPKQSQKSKPTKQDKVAKPSKSTNQETAIQKAVRYLMSQQGSDGLWHSEYYGNLKSGSGISTLVLYAISQTDPACWKDNKKQLQKCVNELLKHIKKNGYVSNADGPDYSNYGSAYLLLALRRLDVEFDADLRNQLIKYLVRSQLDDEEGYKTENDNYGGWDLTGWMTGQRPTTGTNISVTSVVLMALSHERKHLQLKQPNLNAHEKSTLQSIDECFGKARIWIVKCQSEKGGFFFHPEQKHPGNKAGWWDQESKTAKAYGSATADGLECLKWLMPKKDSSEFAKWNERCQKAKKWLAPHVSAKTVPGFSDADSEASWAHGLKYYYWMRVGQSEFRLSSTLAKHIESLQKKDGHWENANARMREDDPLIATSFAVIALANQKAEKKK